MKTFPNLQSLLTVTKERKVFPSLNATARYIRELNPEYKAAVGRPHGNVG